MDYGNTIRPTSATPHITSLSAQFHIQRSSFYYFVSIQLLFLIMFMAFYCFMCFFSRKKKPQQKDEDEEKEEFYEKTKRNLFEKLKILEPNENQSDKESIEENIKNEETKLKELRKKQIERRYGMLKRKETKMLFGFPFTILFVIAVNSFDANAISILCLVGFVISYLAFNVLNNQRFPKINKVYILFVLGGALNYIIGDHSVLV